MEKTRLDEEMKDDRIELIQNLFISRDDVYALQTGEGYSTIREKITPELIQKHLSGEITVGIYCLDKKSMIKWNCFDIDKDKGDAKKLYDYLKAHDKYKQACALEYTGGRGSHVWQFFAEKIPAITGIKIGKGILGKLEIVCELFPKQETVETGVGNLVKLPWGIHKKYDKRSFFIDPTDLKEVQPALVDIDYTPIKTVSLKKYEMIPFIGCIALDRINRGVDQGYRDEAAFFKMRLYLMLGSPRDECDAALKVWNAKNSSPLPEGVLLEKIKSVYSRKYKVGSWSLKKNTLLQEFCESCVNPVCERKQQRRGRTTAGPQERHTLGTI